jgi:hypothetical protein
MSEGSWSSIGLIELINADPRPSVIVELNSQDAYRTISSVYQNQSFAFLSQQHTSTPFSPQEAFLQWSHARGPRDFSFVYGRYRWAVVELRKRWFLLSGSPINPDGNPTKSQFLESRQPSVEDFRKDYQDEGLILMARNYVNNDWTATPPPQGISPWCQFLRDWNWSSTGFGPIEKWSPQLRLMANMICSDSNPAVLWWGETLASLYNEAYVELVKHKHPEALGRAYKINWAEIFRFPNTASTLHKVWDECMLGKGGRQKNVTYFLQHGSRLEESVFHLNMLPVIGDNGETVGVYQTIVDITDEQIQHRRLSTVMTIAELTVNEEDLTTFFSKIIEGLQGNGKPIL